MVIRVLILALSSATLIADTPGASRIGIYHWGGQSARSVSDGVEKIASLGGHVARIALSARYYRDYNIALECRPNFSLAAAAQDADMNRAFGNPAIDVLILTVYDGVTWGDCGRVSFLDPEFYTEEHTAAIVQEYSDFTLYLYRTFQHTHKRFIVSNWESDNSVYCGQAYRYAKDAAFRAWCRAAYPSQLGIASPEEALRGLKLWFQARTRGVVEGRSRAQAEGIGGMRVYTAPEINIVRALREAGLPSVLYDVVPYVMFDYVSYSAWESINTADPVETLREDLETIQDASGSGAIIVGESGFLLCPSQNHIRSTSNLISAALTWGVAYFVQWELYETEPGGAYGIYDFEGRPTALAGWFESRFRQDSTDGHGSDVAPPTRSTDTDRAGFSNGASRVPR